MASFYTDADSYRRSFCERCYGMDSKNCTRCLGQEACEFCQKKSKPYNSDCASCTMTCLTNNLRYVIGGEYCKGICSQCDNYREHPSPLTLPTQAERDAFLIQCGIKSKPKTEQSIRDIHAQCIADHTQKSHCEQAGLKQLCKKCLAMWC